MTYDVYVSKVYTSLIFCFNDLWCLNVRNLSVLLIVSLLLPRIIKMVSIVNSIDTGHEDMIHDAEVDYYGLRLATCSSDNSVKVYDIKSGASTLIDDLKGHFGPVWQIAWSHPKFGNLLASCSYDRKVIIWREQQRKWSKYYEYANHDSSVNSVQLLLQDLD